MHNSNFFFYCAVAVAVVYAAMKLKAVIISKRCIEPKLDLDTAPDCLDTLDDCVVGTKRLVTDPSFKTVNENVDSVNTNVSSTQTEVVSRNESSMSCSASEIQEESVAEPISASSTTATRSKSYQIDPDIRLINIYIAAKPGDAFIGYELLQTILSAGLRFGEMSIFHYYNPDNSDETIFSLASAEEPGTFDLEKIGGFSCRGLCLFYQGREDDSERWDTMLNIAAQLAHELNAVVLDDSRNVINIEQWQSAFEE